MFSVHVMICLETYNGHETLILFPISIFASQGYYVYFVPYIRKEQSGRSTLGLQTFSYDE